jgi:hypothetical protein
MIDPPIHLERRFLRPIEEREKAYHIVSAGCWSSRTRAKALGTTAGRVSETFGSRSLMGIRLLPKSGVSLATAVAGHLLRGAEAEPSKGRLGESISLRFH